MHRAYANTKTRIAGAHDARPTKNLASDNANKLRNKMEWGKERKRERIRYASSNISVIRAI